jgi:hypothetical protein
MESPNINRLAEKQKTIHHPESLLNETGRPHGFSTFCAIPPGSAASLCRNVSIHVSIVSPWDPQTMRGCLLYRVESDRKSTISTGKNTIQK